MWRVSPVSRPVESRRCRADLPPAPAAMRLPDSGDSFSGRPRAHYDTRPVAPAGGVVEWDFAAHDIKRGSDPHRRLASHTSAGGAWTAGRNSQYPKPALDPGTKKAQARARACARNVAVSGGAYSTLSSPSSSSLPSRTLLSRSSLRLARSAARLTSSEPTSSIMACSAPSPCRGPSRTMRL